MGKRFLMAGYRASEAILGQRFMQCWGKGYHYGKRLDEGNFGCF